MTKLLTMIFMTLTPALSTALVLPSDFSQCLRQEYTKINPGPSECDFRNMKVDMKPLLKRCAGVMPSKVTSPRLVDPKSAAQLAAAKKSALLALNNELMSTLYSCGYMGEIEYTENTGRASTMGYTASAEHCAQLSQLIEANKLEMTTASGPRQEQLTHHNESLSRLYAKSNCAVEGESVAIQVERK